MADCIREADTVLVVCTPGLKARYEKTAPPTEGRGASYEGAIVTQHIYDNAMRNTKFFPVLPDSGSLDDLPDFLKPWWNGHFFPSGNEGIGHMVLAEAYSPHSPPSAEQGGVSSGPSDWAIGTRHEREVESETQEQLSSPVGEKKEKRGSSRRRLYLLTIGVLVPWLFSIIWLWSSDRLGAVYEALSMPAEVRRDVQKTEIEARISMNKGQYSEARNLIKEGIRKHGELFPLTRINAEIDIASGDLHDAKARIQGLRMMSLWERFVYRRDLEQLYDILLEIAFGRQAKAAVNETEKAIGNLTKSIHDKKPAKELTAKADVLLDKLRQVDDVFNEPSVTDTKPSTGGNLAASQARLLALTARKSDLELRGQFINQARLQLANIVGSLFSKTADLDPESETARQLQERVEMLQQVDKMLELQLRRVDTQQQAVQTEIRAVQKVIDKNIDMSFKTFS